MNQFYEEMSPNSRSILESLEGNMDYSSARNSMSPFHSDIGLEFNEHGGIATVHLHYNRRSASFGNPFIALPGIVTGSATGPLDVVQQFDNARARYAFYDRNSWMMECSGHTVSFKLPATDFTVKPWQLDSPDPTQRLYRSAILTGDPRDQDEAYPLILGMRVIVGQWKEGNGLENELVAKPDSSGMLLLAFSIECLEIDENRTRMLLAEAPDSIDSAAKRTAIWFSQMTGSLSITATSESERTVLACAAYTLIVNTTKAPGLLANRIASFPNRGHYPAHYLWDSCFQNLALELMAAPLAEDALLLLTGNLRADGKMAHFITSTWIRPKESQPPLVGWAGLRLVKMRSNPELARKLLYPLVHNTRWWMTQRMSSSGLIYCSNPLETGWDNTPRLDLGPVLACDMNTYVLLQMRACEEMATMIDDTATAASQRAMADELSGRMVEVLYDGDSNLFREVLVASGEMLPLKTPACFLPLLADMPLSHSQISAIIEQHLLNPAEFFGVVPFPSVAYDEPAYAAGNWWRGPTWMPVAYLMLQILRKHGYEEQYYRAARKLYAMIITDGKISELFNSQTGEGRGSRQQGWTAAILLRLSIELDNQKEPS